MRRIYHIRNLSREQRRSVCRDMQMLCIPFTSRKADEAWAVEFYAEDWQLTKLRKCLGLYPNA